MTFLRIRDVAKLTGYSIPHIWRLARDGRFPKPIKLGPNASAWIDEEVREWQQQRVHSRDATSGTP